MVSLSFVLVLMVVCIEVSTALLMDYASSLSATLNRAVLTVIGFALFINFLRFLLWGAIHKRFDLSKSYPLTTMFYPLIYVVALGKGEAQLSAAKVIGIVCIVAGLLVLQSKKQQELAG